MQDIILDTQLGKTLQRNMSDVCMTQSQLYTISYKLCATVLNIFNDWFDKMKFTAIAMFFEACLEWSGLRVNHY